MAVSTFICARLLVRRWTVSVASSRLSSTRVSVKSATGLSLAQLPNESVTVCGWVKSARKQKDIVFVDVNDGTVLTSLQVVAPLDQCIQAKEISIGCSVEAEGRLTESSHPGQTIEMKADKISLIGQCDQQTYPFKARKKHGLDYVRQFPHLRARTNSFSSLLRIRDRATSAIHQFFGSKEFLNVHTPILTSSDCEGAGDLFTVKPHRDHLADTDRDEFFGSNVYLTVSGQLHAETITSGMSSVYTFGPTFRAEKSHTRRHLSEFYMVEAETVTLSSGLPGLLDLINDLHTHVVDVLLKENSEDLKLYHEKSPHTKAWITQSLGKPFQRITYTEAVDILKHAQEKTEFQFEPMWGNDLQSEHEQYLVSHFGQLPLFVTDFPADVKAFYARANNDSGTVSAADLLMPGIGEVVGGSMREERADVLKGALQRRGLLDQYQWYLDLRRFGTVPHGGFGLGFERLLQAILGVDNIRDVIPFPRYLGSCDL